MNLISVIIPVYNAEKYLAKCLDSIINQDYPKIEIIIVDDGSTDKSSTIADNYAQDNPMIKVYHRQNCGAHTSRMFGVKQSQGKFIAFVDSDDKLPPKALSQLYEKAHKNNLDIVLGASIDWIDNIHSKKNVNRAGNGIYSNIEYIKYLLTDKCIIGPACKIIKQTLFKNISFELPHTIFQNEDLYMNILTGINCNRIGIFNEIDAYHYSNQNQESLSRGKSMSEESWILLFRKIKEQLNAHHIYGKCEKEYIRYIHQTIYSQFFVRRREIFREYNRLNITICKRSIYDNIIWLINMNRIFLFIFLYIRKFLTKK